MGKNKKGAPKKAVPTVKIDARCQRLALDVMAAISEIQSIIGSSMLQEPGLARTHVALYVDLRDRAARDVLVALEEAQVPTFNPAILGDSETYVGITPRALLQRALADQSHLVSEPPEGMYTVCALGAVGGGLVIAARNIHLPDPAELSLGAVTLN